MGASWWLAGRRRRTEDEGRGRKSCGLWVGSLRRWFLLRYLALNE